MRWFCAVEKLRAYRVLGQLFDEVRDKRLGYPTYEEFVGYRDVPDFNWREPTVAQMIQVRLITGAPRELGDDRGFSAYLRAFGVIKEIRCARSYLEYDRRTGDHYRKMLAGLPVLVEISV